MTTGPGRPLRAISNAVRIVASSFVSSVTQEDVLRARRHDVEDRRLLERVGAHGGARHLAADRTIGTESAWQSRTGVTEFVAPGPEVTSNTPTRPLERA